MRWWRPLLILLFGLVLAGEISGARDPARTTATIPATYPRTAPPVLHATLPADRTVRVPANGVVDLRVTSLVPDVVDVDGLGLSGPVGPDISAPALQISGAPAGTYPVRLELAGTRIGTIIVAPLRG